MKQWILLFGGIIAILVVANIVYLDYQILIKKSATENTVDSAKNDNKIVLATPTLPEDVCRTDCVNSLLEKIKEATASIKPSDTKVFTQSKNAQSASESGVKEIFISFGSGTSSAYEWTDVGGLQAYIDTTKYPKIKSTVFEATVYIPTGNQKAEVRLYNATDKHPVWFSDVSLEGGQTQFLVSQPITLDEGNKLYQIQMKTSLKYPANLTQARVHIILK